MDDEELRYWKKRKNMRREKEGRGREGGSNDSEKKTEN